MLRCACNNVLRLAAASLFTIFVSTCTVINFKLIASKNEKKKKIRSQVGALEFFW